MLPRLRRSWWHASRSTPPLTLVAKVDTVKYVKLKSPFGSVTSVPEGIVDVLLESGYSKSK